MLSRRLTAKPNGTQSTPVACAEALRLRSLSAMPLEINLQIRAELNEIAYGRWEGLTKEQVSKEFQDQYISWLANPAWQITVDGSLKK